MNVVSFGGGTNSTAMIIGMYLREIPIDLILFADTGGERRHTYDFIEKFDAWLTARGRLGDYCVACVEAFDQGRPNPIHADDDRVVRCDCFRPIPEPEEEEQKEGEPT